LNQDHTFVAGEWVEGYSKGNGTIQEAIDKSKLLKQLWELNQDHTFVAGEWVEGYSKNIGTIQKAILQEELQQEFSTLVPEVIIQTLESTNWNGEEARKHLQVVEELSKDDGKAAEVYDEVHRSESGNIQIQIGNRVFTLEKSDWQEVLKRVLNLQIEARFPGFDPVNIPRHDYLWEQSACGVKTDFKSWASTNGAKNNKREHCQFSGAEAYKLKAFLRFLELHDEKSEVLAKIKAHSEYEKLYTEFRKSYKTYFIMEDAPLHELKYFLDSLDVHQMLSELQSKSINPLEINSLEEKIRKIFKRGDRSDYYLRHLHAPWAISKLMRSNSELLDVCKSLDPDVETYQQHEIDGDVFYFTYGEWLLIFKDLVFQQVKATTGILSIEISADLFQEIFQGVRNDPEQARKVVKFLHDNEGHFANYQDFELITNGLRESSYDLENAAKVIEFIERTKLDNSHISFDLFERIIRANDFNVENSGKVFQVLLEINRLIADKGNAAPMQTHNADFKKMSDWLWQYCFDVYTKFLSAIHEELDHGSDEFGELKKFRDYVALQYGIIVPETNDIYWGTYEELSKQVDQRIREASSGKLGALEKKIAGSGMLSFEIKQKLQSKIDEARKKIFLQRINDATSQSDLNPIKIKIDDSTLPFEMKQDLQSKIDAASEQIDEFLQRIKDAKSQSDLNAVKTDIDGSDLPSKIKQELQSKIDEASKQIFLQRIKDAQSQSNLNAVETDIDGSTLPSTSIQELQSKIDEARKQITLITKVDELASEVEESFKSADTPRSPTMINMLEKMISQIWQNSGGDTPVLI